LDYRDQWLALVRSDEAHMYGLARLTKTMLRPIRDKRPTARNLLLRLAILDELGEGRHCTECSQWFDDYPVCGHRNSVAPKKAY
jgi:hypothetical protein